MAVPNLRQNETFFRFKSTSESWVLYISNLRIDGTTCRVQWRYKLCFKDVLLFRIRWTRNGSMFNIASTDSKFSSEKKKVKYLTTDYEIRVFIDDLNATFLVNLTAWVRFTGQRRNIWQKRFLNVMFDKWLLWE